MKKTIIVLIAVIVAVSCSIPIGITAFAAEKPQYRSVFLMDYDTGTVITEENADEKYPIASMVKIMTLAIAFDEI